MVDSCVASELTLAVGQMRHASAAELAAGLEVETTARIQAATLAMVSASAFATASFAQWLDYKVEGSATRGRKR